MEHAIIVHSPHYANWVFDKTHPTQGRRFMLGRNNVILEGSGEIPSLGILRGPR